MTNTNHRTVGLAIGRILRLGSRPSQPGDIAEYERCRAIILDQLLGVGVPIPTTYQPNYCAQRLFGAAGD